MRRFCLLLHERPATFRRVSQPPKARSTAKNAGLQSATRSFNYNQLEPLALGAPKRPLRRLLRAPLPSRPTPFLSHLLIRPASRRPPHRVQAKPRIKRTVRPTTAMRTIALLNGALAASTGDSQRLLPLLHRLEPGRRHGHASPSTRPSPRRSPSSRRASPSCTG